MRLKTFPFGSLLNQSVPQDWLLGSAPAVPAGLSLGPLASVRRPGFLNGGESGDVELLDWDVALNHWDAWSDLSRRSVEPNVFMAPGFALSAVQHVPVAHRPVFLLIWSPGQRGRPGGLNGIFGFQIPKAGSGHLARIWCTPMMALGTPLIDRHESMRVIEQMHKFIATGFRHVHGILFPQVGLAGDFTAGLIRHATLNDLEYSVFDRRVRAVVTNNETPDEFLRQFISAKKHKELRRQRRRLEDMGVLEYRSATSPEDVREAMEKFLALEASGWKGGEQTALLSDPSTATFARSMSRFFAREGACHIDSLELNGKPIAMGIVLNAHDTAFYWKTAYDEIYARYSPGVLFSVEMTTKLIAGGAHELINSCAIPNHPMIDHIWRERIEMGDLCVPTLGSSANAFARLKAKETARRRIRSAAKTAYYAIMRKHAR